MISHRIPILSNNQQAVAERDDIVSVGKSGGHRAVGLAVEDQLVTHFLPGLVFPEARVDGDHLAILKQSEAHFAEQTAFGGGFNPCSNDGRTRA